MASMNPPLLLAMILCDSTLREEGTHKLTLLGTFNGLYSHTFPCTHPMFSVFVALTDGRGKVPCRLCMTSLETGNEIFSLPGQIDFQDPTGVAELTFQLRSVTFEKPGDYAIEFFAEGEPLGSRKLRVAKAP